MAYRWSPFECLANWRTKSVFYGAACIVFALLFISYLLFICFVWFFLVSVDYFTKQQRQTERKRKYPDYGRVQDPGHGYNWKGKHSEKKNSIKSGGKSLEATENFVSFCYPQYSSLTLGSQSYVHFLCLCCFLALRLGVPVPVTVPSCPSSLFVSSAHRPCSPYLSVARYPCTPRRLFRSGLNTWNNYKVAKKCKPKEKTI